MDSSPLFLLRPTFSDGGEMSLCPRTHRRMVLRRPAPRRTEARRAARSGEARRAARVTSASSTKVGAPEWMEDHANDGAWRLSQNGMSASSNAKLGVADSGGAVEVDNGAAAAMG